MPHIMGPAGAPPPPSSNEVKLLAEIAGLHTQLEDERQQRRNWTERATGLERELGVALQVIEAFLDDDKTDEASLRIDLALHAFNKLNEEAL